MQIEEMLAREAIRYTISLYNRAVDTKTHDELVNVFHEDATMEVLGGPSMQGRDKIVEGLKGGSKKRDAAGGQIFQRHNMTSSMIDMIDADNAKARHYIMVVTETGLDHAGMYDDHFRRVGDRWLILHRTARMEWARPESRFAKWLGPSQPAA